MNWSGFLGSRFLSPASPITQSSAGDASAVSYPPVDPGIPCRTVEEVLDAHKDLLSRVKLSYGSDQLTFEKDMLSLVRRYAEYVHLLPATADNHFSGAGGLFRMGLEIAFFALQGTDSQIFSGRSTITDRRNLEPRWRYATFIAGLCSEIHRTLSHLIVIDEKGNEWPPYLFSLDAWFHKANVSRYFLRWIPNAAESRSIGVFALPHIIPSETLSYLSEGNTVIVPHMMACISGMSVYREHNIIDELVRRSAANVIDRDLRSSAHRYGKPQLGSHLERYLIDAMRRLLSSNTAWVPNEPKSRLWYTTSGLYVVWPHAATDIRKLLEADKLPGIPKAPETILEILADAGVVERRDGEKITWQIFPPGCEVSVEAIKLSSPALLFCTLEKGPEPLIGDLTKSSRKAVHDESPIGKTSPRKVQIGIQVPLPGSDQDIEKLPTSGLDGPNPEKIEPTSPALSVSEVKDVAQHEQLVSSVPIFALEAPLRLNPVIRAALSEVIATLNDDNGQASACSIPQGIFVPLSELERRQIDTSVAIRALTDLGMVVPPVSGVGKTITRDYGGTETLGIVINPRFVCGFDPDHFQSTPSNSGSDADA